MRSQFGTLVRVGVVTVVFAARLGVMASIEIEICFKLIYYNNINGIIKCRNNFIHNNDLQLAALQNIFHLQLIVLCSLRWSAWCSSPSCTVPILPVFAQVKFPSSHNHESHTTSYKNQWHKNNDFYYYSTLSLQLYVIIRYKDKYTP